MWFKNLRLYRLPGPLSLSPEELHGRLAREAFRPCTSLEFSTYGWERPLGRHGTELVHAAGGFVMLCARKEDKLLPASVVREVVEARVAERETEQMRTVHRKEREAIREEVTLTLLPQAFRHSQLTYGYLSSQDGRLVVDASSPRKAEDFVSALRHALGNLSIVPLSVQESPGAIMTRWLAGGRAPGDFVIGDECELHDTGSSGAVVRCRRQDLSANEVLAHLKAGKQVVRLGLEWGERLSCVLADDLSVSRLRFSELVEDEASQIETEDYAARFDADFALMALELSGFIARLVEVFGGEETQDSAGVDVSG